MTKDEAIQVATAIAAEANVYLADAMRDSKAYPPAFAKYVEQGVASKTADVMVETAITAIAFAIMAERVRLQKQPA